MTFNELLIAFIVNLDADNYSYDKGGSPIRLIKVPLNKSIKAVYRVKDKVHIDESGTQQLVRTINPEFVFLGIVLDDCRFFYESMTELLDCVDSVPDSLESISTIKKSVFAHFRKVFLTLLKDEPLPVLGKKRLEEARSDAFRAFMTDTEPEPHLYPELVDSYDEDALLFAYASHDKKWAEKLAIEMFPRVKSKCLQEIAKAKCTKQYLEELKEDKNSPLFIYKSMKDAIGSRDCFLLVDCELKDGNKAQLVVFSGCFSNQYKKDYSIIPSLQVVSQTRKHKNFPVHINKEAITKISVRNTGEVLWLRSQ